MRPQWSMLSSSIAEARDFHSLQNLEPCHQRPNSRIWPHRRLPCPRPAYPRSSCAAECDPSKSPSRPKESRLPLQTFIGLCSEWWMPGLCHKLFGPVRVHLGCTAHDMSKSCLIICLILGSLLGFRCWPLAARKSPNTTRKAQSLQSLSTALKNPQLKAVLVEPRPAERCQNVEGTWPIWQASYHFEARPSLSNKRHMWLHKQDSGLLQARTAPTNHLTAATKRYPRALLPPRVRALHPRKAKAVMSKRAVMDEEPSEEAWSKLFSFCCTCLSINPSCPRMVQSSCIHLFLLLALEKSFSRCEVQSQSENKVRWCASKFVKMQDWAMRPHSVHSWRAAGNGSSVAHVAMEKLSGRGFHNETSVIHAEFFHRRSTRFS